MKILSIALALLVCVSSVAAAADFVLITNKDNPVNVVSQKDVKNYYLGKKTSWDDGSPVTVYIDSASPVHDDFLKQMVQKTAQQYTTYWKKSLFTGTGLPPKDFASDDDVIRAVAAQPGAVGYVSAAALNDTVKKLDVR